MKHKVLFRVYTDEIDEPIEAQAFFNSDESAQEFSNSRTLCKYSDRLARQRLKAKGINPDETPYEIEMTITTPGKR